MRDEIARRLKGDFEKRLFGALLDNLAAPDSPIRFNNFSYAFRELVRVVLARLAPDSEIVQCAWYTNELNHENGVTRAQRIKYAIQGGLADQYVDEVLRVEVRPAQSALSKLVKLLSAYTHISEGTFNLEDKAVKENVHHCLEDALALFERIEECRRSIQQSLWERVAESTEWAALSETLIEIDELATHHSIDEVYVDKFEVVTIDCHYVHFQATGTVGCELQWGSNSDRRNGDGAVMKQSFPFTCTLRSSVEQPDEVEAEWGAFCADTSSWWDGYSDD